MDLYTLDKIAPFSALENVDSSSYKSLIWTERFSTKGDFELVTPNVTEFMQKIPIGSILSVKGSPYLMIAQSAKVSKDDDGGYSLTIKGDSLESFLENRPARAPGQTSDTDWTFSAAYPIATAISMVTGVINTGTLNVSDIVAGGNLKMVTSIVETVQTNLIIKSRDLYSAVREVLGSVKCGILPHRYFDGTNAYLYYEVYQGVDRTSGDNGVIFHVANGDIVDASYLFTNDDFYNVAYVYSVKGSRTVYAVGVDPSISSWDRRVLYVDASDIQADADLTVANAAMDERGKQELADHNKVMLFDGKINPISTTYKTPDDYYLGDHVLLIGEYGVMQPMLVEEIIRISDSGGQRTYPTLVTI